MEQQRRQQPREQQQRGRSILVCDDEEAIRLALRDHLSASGFAVRTAANGEEALAELGACLPDALLLDLRMPRLDGLAVLRRMRDEDLNPALVIVMTAHGAVESAIEATKLGAFSYLAKPFDFEDVTSELERLLRQRTNATEQAASSYGAIVGRSPPMLAVFELLRQLEPIDAPTVLVTGETGTGKDLVAREIHARGPRHKQSFVAIDCAAIPETLLESELFGHERGSFTDAHQQKRGLFEIGRGGTIFLDEIGEMPPAMQAKLLRALESRRFRRVGGTADMPLDAGIIAATSRDLRQEVDAGRFRADLFFRLHVVPVSLPPLRKRAADIALLSKAILAKLNTRNVEVFGVDEEALAVLARHPWPGNIRELRNVLERAVILKRKSGFIGSADLPIDVRQAAATHGAHVVELPEAGVNLADVERDLILQALERTGGNKTRAAQLLGITRFALRHRLEKHGALDC